MDIPTLATEAVKYLIPLLPYLKKAGEKAAEEAGRAAAEGTWEQTKRYGTVDVETEPIIADTQGIPGCLTQLAFDLYALRAGDVA